MKLDLFFRIVDEGTFNTLPAEYLKGKHWLRDEYSYPLGPVYLIEMNDESSAQSNVTIEVSDEWENLGFIPVFYSHMSSYFLFGTEDYYLYKKGGCYEIRDIQGRRFYVSRTHGQNQFQYCFDGGKYFNV